MRRILLLILAGCGSVEITPSVPDAAPPIDTAMEPPSMHGKFIVRYFPDKGEVDLPKDLSSSIIDARVGDAIFPGVGLADGTFSIPSVPPGPFMLRVDDTFVDGVIDGVTLTSMLPGRPDQIRSLDSTQAPTITLKLNLTNVAPLTFASNPGWDVFTLYSANAGCAVFFQDSYFFSSSAIGDTYLSNKTINFGLQPFGCRIDPAKGDRTTLAQSRAPVPSDPLPHVYQVRMLDLPAFSGSTKVVDAAMSDVTNMGTLHIDFRPSTFTAVMPGATTSILLQSAERRFTYASAAVGRYPDTGATAMDGIVDLPYPDPFPNGVKQLAVHAQSQVPLVQLDPRKPVNGNGGYAISTRSLDASFNQPIVLTLSPPKDVRVGNATPSMPAANVGFRPTVRWSRPDVAPPGPIQYEVQLSGNEPPHLATVIWTTATSVVLPAGTLKPGAQIAFVRARWSPNPPDYALHPFDGEYPENSMTPTGVFSP